MAKDLRHVKLRGDVFYYERRVPRQVQDRPEAWRAHFGGRRLFRVSLRTKQQTVALSAAAEVEREFDHLVKLALGRPGSQANAGNSSHTRPLTPSLLTATVTQISESMAKRWAQAMVLAELGEHHRDAFDQMMADREMDAERLKGILLGFDSSTDRRMPNIGDQVGRIVREQRLDVHPDTPEWGVLSRAVREGHVKGQRAIDAMLNGTSSVIPEERLTPKQSAAPRLSEAVNDYMAQLRSPRTVREVKTSLDSFINAVGDLRLDEITRAEVVEFCKVEGSKVVGGKTKGSIERPTSPATLKKKLTLIGSAFQHAFDVEPDEVTNPFHGINVKRFTKPVPKAIMPDKRPFSPHELQLLVHHPWFTGCASETSIHSPGTYRLNGMHYWVPIVAMFTGCRAGELGGLRVTEVRLDHQHPHIVIQDNAWRTTKAGYRRLIPILDILIALGFDDYVERIGRAGHDRLFPDWKPPTNRTDAGAPAWSNGQLIRAFNRTVIPQQLRAILTEGTRQEVTFHGFRGAFKTLLGRVEYGLPENHKNEVVGHKKSALDERYVREIPLEETYPAIRRCAYAGLVLPPAP
ncbi:DUF6538 domain-containing protein [Erythrobacter donghaensis]|uniref:DUF6538 domain-containing protein n=1 Tax=Erythrobacter donghaensis TaxID=267135 RepID=UPI000A3CB140|nr:DUF6538 domain-containing protein [Erythrobacter donghaensis]